MSLSPAAALCPGRSALGVLRIPTFRNLHGNLTFVTVLFILHHLVPTSTTSWRLSMSMFLAFREHAVGGDGAAMFSTQPSVAWVS